MYHADDKSGMREWFRPLATLLVNKESEYYSGIRPEAVKLVIDRLCDNKTLVDPDYVLRARRHIVLVHTCISHVDMDQQAQFTKDVWVLLSQAEKACQERDERIESDYPNVRARVYTVDEEPSRNGVRSSRFYDKW